jgi:ABC-2 type transport system ATP-binding protein
MTGAVLALEAVTVRLRGRIVLDRVSLAVPAGAVFALLGRNGAGKTTAFRCLVGMHRPDEGRALLFGRDAWRHRATAMARLGIVPEEPDVPLDMTSRGLAAFSAALYPRWDAAGFAARLRRLSISETTPFGKLSRGHKTQVLITAALAGRPDALILDDPTLGFDVIARRDVLVELVRDLADRGTTTLIATHDIAAVERLASHVGVLSGGRLVLSGELDAIKAEFGRHGDGPLRMHDDGPVALEDVFAAVVSGVQEAA